MTISDFERLNTLLLDALMHRSTEEALLRQDSRTQLLEKRGLSREAVRALFTISEIELTSFARQAQGILANLPNEKGQDITVLRLTTKLIERGFSGEFIEMFERILTKNIGQPTQDAFVMHFSSELRLEEAAQIAKELDQLYRDFVRINYPEYFVNLPAKSDQRYIEVREIRRGSLELYFIAELLNEPFIQGLFVNGVYDVIKASLGAGYKHIMARRNHSNEIDIVQSDEPSEVLESQQNDEFRNQAGEFVERRVREERYFGFGQTKIVFSGTEKVETERRVLY